MMYIISIYNTKTFPPLIENVFYNFTKSYINCSSYNYRNHVGEF